MVTSDDWLLLHGDGLADASFDGPNFQVATMEQGITMGFSNSAMSLGRIAGPMWGGIAFDLNIRYPFWSGAAILLAGFLVSLVRLDSERVSQSDATIRAAK